MIDDSLNNGHRPTIGITMGDPGGIGAEVIVKALADPALRARAKFIVYGMDEPITDAAGLAEINPYWFSQPFEEGLRIGSGVLVADFDEFAVLGRPPAKPTTASGQASMRFLDAAIKDIRLGRLDALVTGPIHKTAWQMAGYEFPGHTELLARRFKTRRVTMMFVGGPLRVALASTHCALFDLRNEFTIGYVFQPIDLLHEALRDWFGIPNPRIGVAGLNPHAGENGRFGDEEIRIIEPAVNMARDAGIDAIGPLPADTMFWRAARREFDGVVAMYHDQGLIPVKLLAFENAVNLTLGLPIIRTSVDHGTAFDIAGRNRADAGSMQAALELAIELAAIRGAARHAAGPQLTPITVPQEDDAQEKPSAPPAVSPQ